MNRIQLRPQIDVPLVMRLDRGPDGKEVQSLRGDRQYQYTVNDDSGIIWLPPEARTALMRTGAQAGDHVQLVKSLRGRNAIWNAEVLPDADVQQQPSRMVAPRAAYQAPRQMPNGHTPERRTSEDHPPYLPPPPDPQPRPQPAAPAAAAAPLRIGDIMQRALEISARANWSAYLAAKAAGCEIDAPTWEDVRAAGISMFIEHNRNGGGR